MVIRKVHVTSFLWSRTSSNSIRWCQCKLSWVSMGVRLPFSKYSL